MAYAGVGNLIKLLPTGTVFVYQFLSPVLTNYGHCTTLDRYLAGTLLFLCGASCCFSCFTDSYAGTDGRHHYGLVTTTGLWPFVVVDDVDVGWEDLSKYKLRAGDFVHAAFSAVVFAVLVLTDQNTMSCYCPLFQTEQRAVLTALPTMVGAIASFVFMVYPNMRHGIGYPPSKD